MKRHRGFTLFELILAIALSAVLLALIGTAINLYLTRVDAGRMRVEESQLARSILAMIADDIRATTIYQPQDTKAIAKLMEQGTPFDVDSIDAPSAGGGGSDTDATGSSLGGGASSGSSSTSGSSSGTTSIGSSSSLDSGESEEGDGTMPLGVSGTFTELYVDATRLPRRDELFTTVTGYTNAPLPTSGQTVGASGAAPVGGVPPADLKTVRYFVRPGEQIEAGSIGATSLAPDLQQRAGGLVRQEIPRSLRLAAEQTGNSAVLEGGQVLVAPEVVQVEFRYYDGSQVSDVWDMTEEKALPRAVEVRIWLAAADDEGSLTTPYDLASRMSTARLYRQTVYLPMCELSESKAMDEASLDEEGSDTSSGEGSSFDGESTGESDSQGGSQFGSL